MKKISKIFILIILVFLFILISTYILKAPIPLHNLPTSVSIVTLPSPPHFKIVTDSENIDLIFSMINESDLKPIFFNEKGWQIRLIYKGGDIAIIENKIRINGRWYKANNDISLKFNDFYLNLDLKEELWR